MRVSTTRREIALAIVRSVVHDRRPSAAGSPLPVVRENVISCLHDRVAREPALGVVTLRRLVSRGAGLERIGRSVILERGPSPAAAVREPLAILHHEVDVMQAAGTVAVGNVSSFFGFQWIFAILEPSGKGLPLPGMPDW